MYEWYQYQKTCKSFKIISIALQFKPAHLNFLTESEIRAIWKPFEVAQNFKIDCWLRFFNSEQENWKLVHYLSSFYCSWFKSEWRTLVTMSPFLLLSAHSISPLTHFNSLHKWCRALFPLLNYAVRSSNKRLCILGTSSLFTCFEWFRTLPNTNKEQREIANFFLTRKYIL